MKGLPLINDKSTKQALLEALIDPISKEVEKQKEYLSKSDQLFNSYLERINRIDSVNGIGKYISETIWLKKELYNQLETEFPTKDDTSIFEFYTSYYNLIDELLPKIPEQNIEEQNVERFRVKKTDFPKVQVLKPFKQLFFFIGKLPVRLTNLFRKEKKAINYWNHRIPVRSMIEYHFKHALVFKSLNYFNEIQQLKCDARNTKWVINQDINLEVASLLDKQDTSFDDLKTHLNTIAQRGKIKEVIEGFDQKLSFWKEDIIRLFDETLVDFSNAHAKVDTIELDIDFYSSTGIEGKSKSTQFEFKKILNGWRNTQFAQIDDFQIDLELYQLKYSGLVQYYLLEGGCQSRIENTIAEFITPIKEEIENVIDSIDQLKDVKEIKNLLVSERIKLNHQLEKKSIPLAIDAIYENNFPYLIERMESKIRTQMDSIKNKRIIYSRETYDAPIAKSNLSHFNPKELVELDLINPFSNSLLKLKTELSSKLQATESSLNDLIGIVDYNLDTATNSIDSQLPIGEVKSIAKEGLERACSKTSDIIKKLEEVTNIIDNQLKSELNKLNIELVKLTENENITNLRLKLAKAKAIEKTQAYRKELLHKLRNFIPILLRFLNLKWRQVKAYSLHLQEKIGLTEVNNEMTSELSDFLLQSEKAIEQLPFVYRRLFEVKALEEENFFEGRVKEIEDLNAAFQKWEESKISSAVIVGEKGSGTSSLLNLFVKQHEHALIIRHQLEDNICSDEDFWAFFDQLFEEETLTDFESIVTFLNTEGKKIIILEDIQHFYLKKPNGFEAISLLFELISQTAKNIFWLVGTTTFSWNYFQKTIAIERYIKHKIILSPLTGEQIIRLIMKRHKVSGYNLRFESEQNNRRDLLKSIRKPIDTSQEGVKKLFFDELNQFAQSNISLALLYWLRSTISFEDNTVVIGRIKNIRFDFLNTLDTASIFTLHTLLLHDGLTVSEHAAIFHQAEKQSRMVLMVLEDSGILKLNNGKYSINRLIYRQVVNVLRNKNLIH